jgi:hypothetical protein
LTAFALNLAAFIRISCSLETLRGRDFAAWGMAVSIVGMLFAFVADMWIELASA